MIGSRVPSGWRLPPRLRQAADAAAAFVPREVAVLSGLLLAAYALGLLADRLLIHYFAGLPELDAYTAAIVLPGAVLDIVLAGAVVGPFLPLLTRLSARDRAAAREFAGSVLFLAVAAAAAVAAVVFAFAPQTAAFVAPGLDPAQTETYAGVLRVVCASQILLAASLVLGEVLVAEHKLAWYGLAGVLYNGGVVAGFVLLSGSFGVYGAAIGAAAGAAAHLGVRVIGVRHLPLRPSFGLTARAADMGRFAWLVGGRLIGQPFAALTLVYLASLAATLAPGSVASVSFAASYAGLPEMLVGASFAVFVFPALSGAATGGDRPLFARILAVGLARSVVLSAALTAVMFATSGVFVRALLNGGAFDAVGLSQTAMVASIMVLAAPALCASDVLAKAVFATRNSLWTSAAAGAGFVVAVVVASYLSGRYGLAAVPAGYLAGSLARLAVLAAATALRASGIGRPVRRARRAGTAEPPAPYGRRYTPTGVAATQSPLGRALAVVGLLAVLAGSVFAAGQVAKTVVFGADPAAAPWARLVAPQTSPAATSRVVAQTSTPQSSASPGDVTPPAPSFTPAPGPFSMDLYKKGDYVEELVDTWCVPAAMQTSMNIMDATPDTSRDTQARLYDLAASLGPHDYGGADPEGWAKGLTQLGYGYYNEAEAGTLAEAVHVVARQIRLTGRPAGLLVWYGWHSWVVSGFAATADPAATDDYTVTGLYIEDVWYNRYSSIWGYSRPPDTLVAVGDLPGDYKAWRQSPVVPTRQGKFVYVEPTVSGSPEA